VSIAKQAGMKYFIVTAKHHDGFAMFDSPSSNYNIKMRTPYAKDPMKELVDACHKHVIKFGFYYSLGRDWEDPDVPTNWPTKGGRSNLVDFPNEDAKVFNKYFERKVKPQMKELLTQYGAIDIIWFDTPELISPAESKELLKLINTIQPKCIVNSRVGNNLGDYKVLEQEIVKGKQSALWESCITMSKNWGYIKYDSVYKSPELMVRQLLEIVSKGGNLLLNIGPNALGEITQPALDRFAIIGKWMDKNSEGIYGTRTWKVDSEIFEKAPVALEIKKNEIENTMKDAENDATSKTIIPEVRFLGKGNDLYAYVCSFYGKRVLIKTLSAYGNQPIKNISLLGSKKKVKWKQTSEGLMVDMPTFAVPEIPIVGFKIEL
jgi:alpha-L-fucosidase